MSDKKSDKKKGINWTAEKIMSSSALMVSVISVVALLYQLSLSREENALIRQQQSASVLPHLTITYTTNSKEYRVIFVNKGVGPAFVKKVEYTINDNLKFNRSDFFFNHIREKILERDSVSIPFSTYSFMEGDVLTADSELRVLTLFGAEARELYNDYLKSVDWGFEIVYEDIYGAKWSLKSGQNSPVPIEEE